MPSRNVGHIFLLAIQMKVLLQKIILFFNFFIITFAKQFKTISKMENQDLLQTALLKYGEKIKEVLIQLAVDDELPMDMTQLDSSIFDPCISPLVDTLICIQEDANMALDNSWDRSDDGFEAQLLLIESVL